MTQRAPSDARADGAAPVAAPRRESAAEPLLPGVAAGSSGEGAGRRGGPSPAAPSLPAVPERAAVAGGGAAGGSPRAAASDQGMSGLGGRSSSDEWSSSPEPKPGPLPAGETLRACPSRLSVPLSSAARVASACLLKVMMQRPRATEASVVRTTSGQSPASAKVSQMRPGLAPLRRPRTSTARPRTSSPALGPAAPNGAGGAVAGRGAEAARRPGRGGGRGGRSSSEVAPACPTSGPQPAPKSRVTVSARPWTRSAPWRRQTSSASAASRKVT